MYDIVFMDFFNRPEWPFKSRLQYVSGRQGSGRVAMTTIMVLRVQHGQVNVQHTARFHSPGETKGCFSHIRTTPSGLFSGQCDNVGVLWSV